MFAPLLHLPVEQAHGRQGKGFPKEGHVRGHDLQVRTLETLPDWWPRSSLPTSSAPCSTFRDTEFEG